MKNIVIFGLFFLATISSYSQIDLVGTYNSMQVGRNYSITFKKDFRQHSILIGGKYHINNIVGDDQNSVFFKKFYATTSKQHWGFNIGYQYNLNIKWLKIHPFLFYDFQYTHAYTRNLMFNLSLNHPGEELYIRSIVFFGPTYALEHNIGIGFQQQIWNRFYLVERIGTGFTYYREIDKRFIVDSDKEVGSLLSIGLLYRIKE